jgi:hypothetical protein
VSSLPQINESSYTPSSTITNVFIITTRANMRASQNLLFTIAATLPLFPTTTAGHYDFTIYLSHFCDPALAPQTYYSYSGDDSNCHGLGLDESGCRFFWDGGASFDDCKNNGQPTSGTSISFRDDSGGLGCELFFDQHCSSGSLGQIVEVEQYDGCYDFQVDGSVDSFRCNL